MKEIKLTQGKVALVDDADYEELSKHNWCANKGRITFYAGRGVKIKGKHVTIPMHRVIMKTPKGMDTDHIDGNGLNNQRENLRICTHAENSINRGKCKSNTSGYKGVSWHGGGKKWLSKIRVKRKQINLGIFLTKEEAYKAYCEGAKKYHGEFSNVR